MQSRVKQSLVACQIADAMKKLLVAWVGAVALTTGQALAADLAYKAPSLPASAACPGGDIVKANNQVSVDFTETAFWYGPEITSPVPPGFASAPTGLDAETAYLPGLRVTGSAMGNIGTMCNLYISGSFSWSEGNTSYFQFGGPSAINQATVEDWDFRLGKGFNVGSNGMITPYFGAGTNWWNRQLTGTGGYDEIYKHTYAGAGILLQVSPGPGWVLSVDGLVGSTFSASLVTSLTPGGSTGICVCTFPLGGALTYMAGGSVDYAITEHVHANAGVEYTYFQYGQSPLVTAPSGPNAGLQFLEPNSKTSYLTTSVGLGYHW
jgi:hypothetical protein